MGSWTPDRWQRAKELLARAVELSPSERQVFLAEACGADRALREELDELLSYHHSKDSLFDTPALARVRDAGGLSENEAPTTPRDPDNHAASPQPYAVPGEPIDGKYRLEEPLGKGGMGIVYRATHLGLGKQFAIKLIRSDEKHVLSAERFQTEARALGKLEHPGIVRVSDYGMDSRGRGLPYLVMEYLDGITLAERIRDVGPLSIADALPILQQVAEAVDYAHAEGVLHSDLKPANVFLLGAFHRFHAKILDFGLAKLLTKYDEPGLGGSRSNARPDVQARVIAGTPGYVAPEVLRGGDATVAADIYAFGVLAYETLVGRRPFDGYIDLFSGSELRAPSTIRSTIPHELDEALLAPLALEPGDRPSTAREIVQAIRRGLRAAQRRKWRSREIPRRAAIVALLTLTAVPASSFLERVRFTQLLEQRMVDWRFAWTPVGSPDSRIVLLSVDEASLAADGTPLTDRADEFGRAIARVFRAGASSVAIDFLLPETWSGSALFSRMVLDNRDRLTLAAYSSPEGLSIGTRSVRGLTASALGPAGSLSLFGYVNVEVDGDGVVRRGRRFYRDDRGDMRPSLVGRATRSWVSEVHAPDSFWIDHSVDRRDFRRISWKDLDRALAEQPELFREKLVLVGGEFAASGDEHHRVPDRLGFPNVVSGLTLHALMANTALRNWPIREPDSILRLLLVSGLALPLVAAPMFARPRTVAAASLLALVAYIAVALLLFRLDELLVPVGAPVVSALGASGAALLVRRKLPRFPE